MVSVSRVRAWDERGGRGASGRATEEPLAHLIVCDAAVALQLEAYTSLVAHVA